MYIPAFFRETDLAQLDWLAANDSFGTLISLVDAAPFATHLPVLYRRQDDQVKLVGHWARANPQWQAIEGQRVLFIFHGPHAYISPRWYADPQRNVPTWNYAAAHLYGEIQLVQEPGRLKEIVTALADQYEGSAPSAWRLPDSDDGERLRGIVGFELIVQSIEIKFKLNQNHVAPNVTGAIAGLKAQGRPQSTAIAQLMEHRLAGRADQ